MWTQVLMTALFQSPGCIIALGGLYASCGPDQTNRRSRRGLTEEVYDFYMTVQVRRVLRFSTRQGPVPQRLMSVLLMNSTHRKTQLVFHHFRIEKLWFGALRSEKIEINKPGLSQSNNTLVPLVRKCLRVAEWSFHDPLIESKWRRNVSSLHLCGADHYHNSFEGHRENAVGGSGESRSPWEVALRS